MDEIGCAMIVGGKKDLAEDGKKEEEEEEFGNILKDNNADSSPYSFVS
jgi:hypothetical protein